MIQNDVVSSQRAGVQILFASITHHKFCFCWQYRNMLLTIQSEQSLLSKIIYLPAGEQQRQLINMLHAHQRITICHTLVRVLYVTHWTLCSVSSFSERPSKNQDGERHPGRRQPPVCCQTALWWVSLELYFTSQTFLLDLLISLLSYCFKFQKHSSVMFPDLPLNQIWLKAVCFCSIPDWREAVLDPRLPQRRRSLHSTLQRGESDSSCTSLCFAGLGSVVSLALFLCPASSPRLPPRWCSRRRMWSFI